MLRRTTSMPTPRPLSLVTSLAVEKPGSKISLTISASAGWLPRSTRPLSQARCNTLSRLMPRPSSPMRIRMLPDSWQADSVSRPCAALPEARRCAGVSRPWSSALRTRCISGSAMRSTTDLSSSVSPPWISSVTSLPRSDAVSRTTRRSREKVSPIGTMRSCSVPLRISSMSLPIWVLASISARCRVWRASSCAPAPAITSSPSRLITASSRSAWTRMKRWSSAALWRWRAGLASRLGSVLGGPTGGPAGGMAVGRVGGSASPCAGAAGIGCASSTTGSPLANRSTQSSRTKLKAASISACAASVTRLKSKPRWQLSASSESIAGSAARSQCRLEISPIPAR